MSTKEDWPRPCNGEVYRSSYDRIFRSRPPPQKNSPKCPEIMDLSNKGICDDLTRFWNERNSRNDSNQPTVTTRVNVNTNESTQENSSPNVTTTVTVNITESPETAKELPEMAT